MNAFSISVGCVVVAQYMSMFESHLAKDVLNDVGSYVRETGIQ